jgi:hypothetical protein
MADLIFINDPAAQQSVRNLVQVGLTSAMLTDDQIMDDAIGGAAESLVRSLVPDVVTLTDDQQAQVRMAVIYETAATVLEALPMTTSERHGDEMQVSIARVDTVQRIVSLRSRSQGFLAALLVPANDSGSVSFFDAVPAFRSRGY